MSEPMYCSTGIVKTISARCGTLAMSHLELRAVGIRRLYHNRAFTARRKGKAQAREFELRRKHNAVNNSNARRRDDFA